MADPVELVITSVGAPGPAVEPLHGVGTSVFADVATLHHARRALEAGADGLILLTAGAGGQTGWLNPFAFVRAVRQFFDGPLVLAGGDPNYRGGVTPTPVSVTSGTSQVLSLPVTN